MVDVVANHMGNQDGGQEDFSQFVPFNDSSHYHPYCIIQDFTNQHQVQFCRLAGLPDLAQENAYVAGTLTAWIANITRTFGFDGIRIDTVPEVPPQFWAKYGAAAGVFAIGEVDDGRVSYNAQYQTVLDATLNYPFYYTLKDCFQSKKSMHAISARLQEEATSFRDTRWKGGGGFSLSPL